MKTMPNIVKSMNKLRIYKLIKLFKNKHKTIKPQRDLNLRHSLELTMCYQLRWIGAGETDIFRYISLDWRLLATPTRLIGRQNISIQFVNI